jgi:DNA mismatch repair ATPase MutS
MKPYTHIHSYLNIPDTSGRDSLFQAESRRCKEILNIINNSSDYCSRHFCIFDELYSGTNPNEATKSAFSFLLYLSNYENVDFILTTHYVDICNRLKKASNNRIENWKMNADSNENGEIQYNYTISKGISTIQGAIKVLRDMDYPNEIIQSMIEYDYAVAVAVVESQVLDAETPILVNESPVLVNESPVLEDTTTKEPKKKRNRKQK